MSALRSQRRSRMQRHSAARSGAVLEKGIHDTVTFHDVCWHNAPTGKPGEPIAYWASLQQRSDSKVVSPKQPPYDTAIECSTPYIRCSLSSPVVCAMIAHRHRTMTLAVLSF